MKMFIRIPSEEGKLEISKSNESNTEKTDNRESISSDSTKRVVISSRDLIEAFNRGNGDSHTDSVRNEGMISCPLCGRGIIVEHESEETKSTVMNKHIDRCSRVMQSKVNSKERESTMSAIKSRTVSYNEDFSADDSDGEEYKPKVKNNARKRLKKTPSKENVSLSRGTKEYIFPDETSDEEGEEEEYKPQKKARSRKAQTVATAVIDSMDQSNDHEIYTTTADHNKVEDDVDADQNEELIHNTTVAIVSDDWETNDYQNRISELDTEYVDTQFGGRFYAPSWEKLFDYQKEGCRWLFDLYQEGVGGILGDEMGEHSIHTLLLHMTILFNHINNTFHFLNIDKLIIGLGKTAQICNHFCALSSDHCERFSFREESTQRSKPSQSPSASFLVVSEIVDTYFV